MTFDPKVTNSYMRTQAWKPCWEQGYTHVCGTHRYWSIVCNEFTLLCSYWRSCCWRLSTGNGDWNCSVPFLVSSKSCHCMFGQYHLFDSLSPPCCSTILMYEPQQELLFQSASLYTLCNTIAPYNIMAADSGDFFWNFWCVFNIYSVVLR